MRIPTTLMYGKYSYQGEILDISTNSIAINFSNKISDKIDLQEVELRFKLPDNSVDIGFC